MAYAIGMSMEIQSSKKVQCPINHTRLRILSALDTEEEMKNIVLPEFPYTMETLSNRHLLTLSLSNPVVLQV